MTTKPASTKAAPTAPLTPDQFRKQLIDQGITHKQWAESRGYDPEYCSRVLTGMVKGVRGKGHEIKVAMGLKVDSNATNEETDA